MKKWIPLFLLLVFAYDVAIDASDANCADQNGKIGCHMCVCQHHFVPDSVVGIKEKLHAAGGYIPLPSPVLSIKDFSKAFFHPPKVLA